MQITVDIPEQLAERIIPKGVEPPRATLEALAIEGYRAQRLSKVDILNMLGFETTLEVHSFLVQHAALEYCSSTDACAASPLKMPLEAIAEIRRLRKGTLLNGLNIKKLISEGRKY